MSMRAQAVAAGNETGSSPGGELPVHCDEGDPRRYPRVLISEWVEVTTGAGTRVRVPGCDISPDGLQLAVDREGFRALAPPGALSGSGAPPSMRIRTELCAFDERIGLDAACRLVHVGIGQDGSYRLTLRFEAMGAQAVAALERFILDSLEPASV